MCVLLYQRPARHTFALVLVEIARAVMFSATCSRARLTFRVTRCLNVAIGFEEETKINKLLSLFWNLLYLTNFVFCFKVQLTQVESDVKILDFSFHIK